LDQREKDAARDHRCNRSDRNKAYHDDTKGLEPARLHPNAEIVYRWRDPTHDQSIQGRNAIAGEHVKYDDWYCQIEYQGGQHLVEAEASSRFGIARRRLGFRLALVFWYQGSHFLGFRRQCGM